MVKTDFEMRTHCILLMLLSLAVSLSCEKRPEGGSYPSGGTTVTPPDPGDVPESSDLDICPISSLNAGEATVDSHSDAISRSSIALDYRSYRILGQDVTGVEVSVYPRMALTPDGECQLFYHKKEGTSVAGNRIYWMTSDDLINWKSNGLFTEVFDITDSHGNPNKQGFADCFPLTLDNGEMISITSTRAVRTVNGISYRENKEDAGLVIKRSSDKGNTWSAEFEKIYTGNNWEPFLLQKSNGDIHCYFTDSNQNLLGVWDGVYNNSGTALIVSRDNGKTWSAAKRISAKLRDQKESSYLFTDQMPTVIELSSGELVGAFESDKAKGGQDTDYHISFAYSGTDGEWDEVSATAGGPSDRIDYLFQGCAPYLVHFPSGENLVSYNYDGKFCMRMSTDAEARNWGEEITAFPETGYFWGAMMPVGTHQVFAAIGGSEKGMQIGQFVLNHDITATSRTVEVDGDNKEWAHSDEAFFVGSKSQAQMAVRCSVSPDKVYFMFDVLDSNISVNDYVTILAAAPDAVSLSAPAVRITASVGGLRSVETYSGSGWSEAADADVVVKTAIDGTTSTAKDEDNGYLIEIAIAKSLLPVDSGEIKADFSLFDMSAGEDSVQPAGDPSVWPKVRGL